MLIMTFRAFLFNRCLRLAAFFLFLARKLSRGVVPSLRRDQSAEQISKSFAAMEPHALMRSGSEVPVDMAPILK